MVQMNPSLFLDIRYINLLAPYLPRFHKKDEHLYNFRCPICGDSATNKYKARGYFYARSNRMWMTCHNCNSNMSFSSFLKIQDASLFREYRIDAFKESGASRYSDDPDNYYLDTPEEDEPSTIVPVLDLKMPCINDLESNHFARVYVANRLIPKDQWHRLYYSSVFSVTIGELFPKYYDEPRHVPMLAKKESRLAMPYYDREKNLLGVNGRAFDEGNAKRYIIAKAHKDALKVYGLDTIDLGATVYVMEGPLDSLFIPNSLATMDGNLNRIDAFLGGLKILHRILVPDNQPRNKDVCRMIKTAIDEGEAVCLWPSDIQQKDINDMVKEGKLSPYEIQNIIERYTYKGLSATYAFSRWHKII